MYDLARATRSQLTTHTALDRTPLWTPDGQRIIFASNRAGTLELFSRQADGTGSDERLLPGTKGPLTNLFPTGWSADGKQLLFTQMSRGTSAVQCAIGQMPIERPSDAKVVMKNEFCNTHAAVSPDGRLIAYRSRVSDRDEIYVERYPQLGDRKQISTGGGYLPVWSRDSRELFFHSPESQQMLAVRVPSGSTLVPGRAQELFKVAVWPVLGGNRPYDVARDGRFFIIQSAQTETGGGTASSLILVQHWFDELKRLVPVN
jgi:Tol biopolymer transport system component